jgi:hypothetical protein
MADQEEHEHAREILSRVQGVACRFAQTHPDAPLAAQVAAVPA